MANQGGVLPISAGVAVLFLPTAGLGHHGGGDHRDRGALLRLCECDDDGASSVFTKLLMGLF